jgi:hypothetical protein
MYSTTLSFFVLLTSLYVVGCQMVPKPPVRPDLVY